MVRSDKQNHHNNAPDDNEDHDQCPDQQTSVRGGGVRGESAWRNLYVLNLGLDIFGFRIFYDMRLLSPALARGEEM